MASKPTSGIVQKVYPGEDHYDPAMISYDVAMVNEDGSETIVKGVGTSFRSSQVEEWAAQKGTVFSIAWIIDQPFFQIYQPPFFKVCDTSIGGTP